MTIKTEQVADLESDPLLAEVPDTGVELLPLVPPPPGPGAQMTAQREAHGWTIEQVATQLNLAPRQIHALETENFAALPGVASTRGFIRSYARLLKLDPQAMLDMTGPATTASLVEPMMIRRAKPTPFFADSRMSALGLHGSRPILKRVVAGVLVLLLLAACAAYLKGWLPPVARLLGQPLAGDNMLAPNTQPLGAPLGDDANVSDMLRTPLSAQYGSPATRSAPGALVAPANKDALMLNFRQDSWFELRHGSGNEASNVIAARVAKGGTSASFDVIDLNTVTIGNVAGVDATLRGKPLDLKSAAKNNVVRLPLK